MRVTRVEVWKVVVPMKPDTVSSACYPDSVLDTYDQIPKHIIRIHTRSGYCGIGETQRGVSRAAVDECIAALLDQDLNRLPLLELPLPRNSAYDAFETAVLDCLGRAREVPVHILLGGKYHDRIPVDYWMGLTAPECCAERTRRGLAEGFHGIKMKAKLELPNLERVAAIKALAPDWTITIDPNERFYRPAGALELARELSGFTGILFESPVPQRRLDWYQRLRDTLGLPIALHLGTMEQLIPALEMGCADVYNLNGSMTQFVLSTRAAHAAGCPVWHGSGVDLGILNASFAQACAATPADLWPSDILQFLREDDLLEEPLPMANGHVLITDQPGLGVELDVAAVERYQVRTEQPQVA
ncbi:MAG: hypothetical protein HUU35_18135 [Armatimonadetes bacterium]|nr:hypothetical protein [Armatimonadota bacterium]